MDPQVFVQYAGAWTTTELVGRREVLDQIELALGQQELQVFYITGPGGIGKTFLLREVLCRCQEGGSWSRSGLLPMTDLLDFYHTTNHPLEGFTQALRKFLAEVPVEQVYFFSLFPTFAKELDAGKLSSKLREQFQEHSRDLTSQARVEVEQAGANWSIIDPNTKARYFVRSGPQTLDVYEPPFAHYDQVYQAFLKKKYDLAGMLKEVATLRDRVTQVFLEDLNRIARDWRLVLAFDTTERLLYETDRIQERLKLEPERVPILQWLLRDFLPHLDNAVILLAGRPQPQRLRVDLQQALGDRLQEYELGPFLPDETNAYFGAVAAKIEQAADEVRQDASPTAANEIEAAAKRVRDIPTPTREVIWHLTAGRPILLSLMVDYLLASDQLHPAVLEPLPAVRAWGPDRLTTVREEIKADLVRFWRENGRVEDPVIEALTWARRGLDAELLAAIAGLWQGGQPDLEEAARLLQNARGLSFVKVRPEDQRLFLHDEMYTLLDENWRSKLPGPPQDEIYKTILSYCKIKVLAKRSLVRDLGIPRSEQVPDWDHTPMGQPRPPDDPAALTMATATLYATMAEEIYYRLRRDPMDGFRTYQIYAKEAFWASDENLDHLLRSEMLIFLEEHEGQDRFDGLSRVQVDVDTGLRRLERLNRQSYEKAAKLAHRIREECGDLLEQAGLMARMRLQILDGEALLYLGEDLDHARRRFDEAIAQLSKPLSEETRFSQRQHDLLLAEAYNDLGYLYRTLGWFDQAEKSYMKAVAQWRELEEEEQDDLRRRALRAQHANTLNNRAWALAELGRFEEAETLCDDALLMRRALGSRAPIGFSLNTLGLILLRGDKPHRARVQCERALGIFRDLDQPRGIGLASIALAEALRRMSDVQHLYAPEEIANLLRRASIHATDAVQIFDEIVNERARQVEAHIERGCIYRHWAWLRPQYEPDPARDDLDQETLVEMSRHDLREAMRLAGDTFVFRRLDAHVNLAWLYYYVARYDISTYGAAEGEAQVAIGAMPERYRQTSKHSLPDPEDPDLPHKFYWSLLGKTYMVLGQIYTQQFEEKLIDPSTGLRQAGYFYTLALAYDELFALEYRDIHRAIHRIYGRFKRRNRQELDWMYEGIVQAVDEFSLAEPTRLQKELATRGILVGMTQ